MMTKRLKAKLVALIDSNHVLDERFRYELHQRGRAGLKRHATLAWCPAAEEWVATFATAGNKIFLDDAEAVQWLQAWPELHDGRVQKVTCNCHRCADEDFTELVRELKDVSHGTCPEHRAEMIKRVSELKEGA